MTWEAWATCGIVLLMVWSLPRGVAGADVILMSTAVLDGCSVVTSLPDVTVLASHALLVDPAVERLGKLPLRRLVVTDSVPVAADLPLPLQVESLAPLLADAIRRLHEGRSLDDLIAHG